MTIHRGSRWAQNTKVSVRDTQGGVRKDAFEEWIMVQK